jgi:adenine-specific DNA-methyltransferase
MSRHIDKEALVAAIKQSQELSDEQKADILELISTKKKYGLVWEDSIEDAYEELKNKQPILREVENRRILNDTDSVHYPNHILIEGENLQALVALTYTHAGTIDVIYIDPPYNTGNKDFVYNDSYIDSEDSYRHSKWLSFMEKRLRIAKSLLSETGVIFISIDDNEQAQLKLLCDEVFGIENFVGNVIWEKTDSPRMDVSGFTVRHDYILVYKKSDFTLKRIMPDEIPEHYNKVDEKGRRYYLKPLRLMGGHKSDSLYFGIEAPDGSIVYPKETNGENGCWRWSKIKYDDEIDRIEWVKGKKGWSANYRIYADNLTPTPANTIWPFEKVGSTRTAKMELSSIVQQFIFSYPKPSSLISFIEKIASDSDSIILDFFAGSGTTMHATMQLNAEDGGHRQCILVTNNENNICEEVTFERNKRVIQGYTTPKGEQVAGLTKNNLRYYKLDLIERTNDHQQNRELMRGLKDLLCIKDNIFQEVMQFGSLSLKGKESMLRCFTEGEQQMLMVYDSRVIPYLVREIMQMPKTETQIKIYLFADGAYPYTEDFAAVMNKVQLIPMPYAYLRAIKYSLPEANPSWAENADLTENEQQKIMTEAIEAENNENE